MNLPRFFKNHTQPFSKILNGSHCVFEDQKTVETVPGRTGDVNMRQNPEKHACSGHVVWNVRRTPTSTDVSNQKASRGMGARGGVHVLGFFISRFGIIKNRFVETILQKLHKSENSHSHPNNAVQTRNDTNE